jgi:alpha-galactosidase
MADLVNSVIHLRAGQVSLLVDLTGGQLPAILYWGADLGDLAPEDGPAMIVSGLRPLAANLVDQPIRLALLPEHRTGWVGRPGLSGSRAGRAWSPEFTVTQVLLDGQSIEATAEPASLVNAGAGSLVVEATDQVAQLRLGLTIELSPVGLLRCRAELTNLADQAYGLNDCVIAYPVPSSAAEIMDFAGHWGKERVPQRLPLTTGMHLREGRKGRTGPDAATLLNVGSPGFGFADGEIWAVHVGWSGNHTHYAERLFTGEQVIGGGELLLPGEVVLQTGESYGTPWVYGAYGVGLDAVARRFHRWLRSRATHPGTDRPVTLNVWEAVYFDHDQARLLDLAERAAQLGVERYVLDDGWFGGRRNELAGLGDWTVSPDVWPDGLHPLVDKVVGLGMQFGLWFEPEMINLDSDTARAHPEWIMTTGNRWPVPSRSQQVINLGNPDCYAYIRDQMLAILDEYPVSYLKWDHNRDLIDAGTAPGGEPGVHAQTTAFYRLLGELKQAHPGLEIESCASGGGRVDLGVIEHADRIWVSDCIDPLERQQMNRWTTQLLPPEMLGSHIASGRSHTTGRMHNLSFRAATAVFGHLGIEWDLARASEEELSELAEWIQFFKEQRSLLMGGDLIRLDFPDPAVLLHGVLAPDRSVALYAIVSMAVSEVVQVGRLRLPGLDPGRRYRVRPVTAGRPPAGLVKPDWWGGPPLTRQALIPDLAVKLTWPSGPLDGVVLSGATLATAGLMAPGLEPEEAVILEARAVY